MNSRQHETQYIQNRMEHYKIAAIPLLPEHFVESIQQAAEQFSGEEGKQYLRSQMNQAQLRYEEFLKEKHESILKELESFKNSSQSSFILTGYDKTAQKIRNWVIAQDCNIELFPDHAEIGSGADGAHMYISTELTGMSDAHFSLTDLIYLTLNAYSKATVNQGVGGTPRLVCINKSGVNSDYPIEAITALVNLSGAYVSRYSDRLTPKSVRKYIGGILEGDQKKIKRVADIVSLDESVLQSVLIPFSSWKDRTNRKLFKGKNHGL